jgi:signal transduction histidine kinase
MHPESAEIDQLKANPVSPVEVLCSAFPGIQESEAGEMVAAGKVNTYPEEITLCREGELEDIFYILLDGEVKVTKLINEREVRLLKRIQPGGFFGEMAIIHNAPRAATVTTLVPVIVLEIQKETFNIFLKRSSSVALAVVREVSRRLRENDDMAIEDLRMKAGELATAYQKLAEQEQARTEFLTTIAHELRTPLMAANGYLQIVRSGNLRGESLKLALETIYRNLQDITALTNNILFLQEMDLIMSNMQPIDVGILIVNVVEQLRDQAISNKVDLALNVAQKVPAISADSKNLERALTAIVDNAIKFSPDGGEVKVEVGYTYPHVWIKIQDHGVGIDPEIRPYIFDRFFHVEKIGNRLFRGTGLGLSIARAVIQQHGGRLSVESLPGQGSTFTIWLPRK